MSAPLPGKDATITRGSKDIGAAPALLLARSGANAVINHPSNSGGADVIVKEIGSDRARAIKDDAGSIPGIKNMVSETVKRFGNIDILIPCAGMSLMRDLEHTTEEDFDSMMRLNVRGPHFLAQVFHSPTPHMSPSSHKVLISTNLCIASTVKPPGLLYNAIKGAIEQMTCVMAKDLAAKGFCVNCVAPGPTGMDLFYNDKSEQLLEMIAGFSPTGRIGKPDEIVEASVWLSGGKSSWVSRQAVRVNGGWFESNGW